MAEETAVRPELRDVAPESLLFEKNVRRDAVLDPSFVSSIRENGVLQPPTVVERADGLHVITGQRRTLASIEAGATEIPVLVVPERAADQLLVDQIVENDARTPLSDGDRVAAFKQLSLLGVGADRIAKRTGAKRASTRAALKIAEHTDAQAGLEAGELTFDDALALAELEEVEPEAVELAKAGISQGTPAAHAVEQARQDLTARRERAEWEAAQRAAGWEPLDDAPSHSDDAIRALSRLFVDEAMNEPLTVEAAVRFEGRVVWRRRAWDYKTGKYVSGDVHGIRGWADQGLFSWGVASASTPDPVREEREKAEKARRRNLRKQWRAATVVRREFIGELLQQKRLPSGWIDAVVDLIGENSLSPRQTVLVGWWVGAKSVKEGEPSAWANIRALKEWATTPHRQQCLLLASALAHVEADQAFEQDGYETESCKAQIERLTAWGYQASTIEQEGK
ncbi:ParB/RepB/Spo0J family partition protein [Pseudoclavibacter sp. 13-3]|uniref:ParB/RepB/Spo0J family partition protein n=1 Tax=Pseudoclavibacter sp. 13-3 TaxID=2901228 RepID=UPI001E56875D|nr:ParB N-terminal domain-containing protein [Pseudoclavibacter sp. 13-3]MCD7100469.1 ParB N-terminal domain-containing protein [Pseudoclavibacter sp. 13-3]